MIDTIKRSVLALAMIPLWASLGHAAAYLSNQNGNSDCDGAWSTPLCWSPAGVPGSVDTWTIRAGDTITIADSRSIGSGVVGTTVAGKTATLTVSGSAVVTTTGSLSLASADSQSSLLNLEAGSRLDMGANTLVLGTAASVAGTGSWRFAAKGTSSSRVTVTGTGAMTYGSASAAGSIAWTHATFQGFGGGINNIGMRYSSVISNCLFKLGNTINFGYSSSALLTTEDLIFSFNDFRQSADASICTVAGEPAADRRREFNGNTFFSPGGLATLAIAGAKATGGYLAGTGNHFYNWKIWERSAGYNTLLGGAYYHPTTAPSGSVYLSFGSGGTRLENSVFFSQGPNNHGLIGGTGVLDAARNEIRGNVFDNAYSSNTSNVIIPGQRTGTLASGNLFFVDGMEAVTFGLSMLSEPSNAVHDVQQNTFILAGKTPGHGVYWEGSAGHVQTGTLNVRNNIFWQNRSGTEIIAYGAGAALPDWIDYIDRNVFFSKLGTLTRYSNVVIARYAAETAAPAWVDASTFVLSGDLTLRYPVGRVVRVFNGSLHGVTTVFAVRYDPALNTTQVMLSDPFVTPAVSSVEYQTGLKNVGEPGYGSYDAQLAVDPQFYAPDRTILSYTGSTKEAFFRALLSRNGFDETGNPVEPTVWSTTDLIHYLREGFTPQNNALREAGEGEVDPGAVPITPTGTHSVTYQGNNNTGGAVPVDSASYLTGETVTVSGNSGNLYRTGYLFTGWNSAADGSGTRYATGTTFTMEHADATLYARWSPIPPPVITGFSPVSGIVGSRVTISGANLDNAAAVTFNGAPAPIIINTATSLIVTVPPAASTGTVGVTTAGGTGVAGGVFTVPAPSVIRFTPLTGAVGTTVTITGTNLLGVTAVTFNGVPASSITIVSATTITATVPSGASTGKVAVIGASGSGSSSTLFTVIGLPAITGVTPASGVLGTRVTLSGTNLGGATAVQFNGIPAVILARTGTAISVTVPAGNVSGPVSVTAATGTGYAPADFTVPLPTITALAPVSGGVGTGVTITGTNFTGATSVAFKTGNAPFVVVSATTIATSVPPGAVSGPITVTTYGGSVDSSGSFTVASTPVLPKIVSFTPATGGIGSSVTIKGNNLVGVTAVKFNNIPVTTFSVLNSSVLVTAVPSGGATGLITIAGAGGTGVSSAPFAADATLVAPQITGFSPASGKAGTSITITGTDLGGVTEARIGGVPAPFKVRSATSLVLTVPSDAGSGTVSIITDGGVSQSSGTFTVNP